MEEKQNQTNYTQAPESGSSNFTRPPKSGSSDHTPTPEHKPKLLVVEMIVGTLVYAASDLFSLLLSPIGLNFLVSGPRTAITWYLINRKKMGKTIIYTNAFVGLITAIPVIGGIFPSTFGWGAIVIMDQFGAAKIEAVMEKTGKIGKMAKNIGGKIGKVTGKVPGSPTS